jgi:hypothetical protein
MLAGVLAAAIVGGLGASAAVAVVVAVAVGLLTQRLRRDRPWTRDGRRRWRQAAHQARAWLEMGRRLWRARPSRPVRPSWVGGDSPTAGASGWHPEDGEEPTGTPITVRCEVVTPRVQVWHSTDTGRAYEVAPERGLPGALPGDLASLAFERGRPRVVRRPLN